MIRSSLCWVLERTSSEWVRKIFVPHPRQLWSVRRGVREEASALVVLNHSGKHWDMPCKKRVSLLSLILKDRLRKHWRESIKINPKIFLCCFSELVWYMGIWESLGLNCGQVVYKATVLFSLNCDIETHFPLLVTCFFLFLQIVIN